MRTTLVPLFVMTLSAAARSQQPVPARPGQTGVAVCPLYVVDGKVVGPAASDCVPVPATAARGAKPDWNAPVPAPATADPLARFLYPPELVMGHQDAIGLTDKQRTAILDAVKDAQSKVVDLQFRMSAEVEKLQHLIEAASPDEPKVLDQVNRVLTAERDMKLAQMTLMVRIKSQLTEAQQHTLDQLRATWNPRTSKD